MAHELGIALLRLGSGRLELAIELRKVHVAPRCRKALASATPASCSPSFEITNQHRTNMRISAQRPQKHNYKSTNMSAITQINAFVLMSTITGICSSTLLIFFLLFLSETSSCHFFVRARQRAMRSTNHPPTKGLCSASCRTLSRRPCREARHWRLRCESPTH